ARIVPQARPDPHQANALVARGTETLLDALQHLVAEPLCVADSPVRAAVPLRDHSVGHLLGNRDGARPGAADRLRRLPKIALLHVDLLHQVVELSLVETPPGAVF